MTNGDLSQVLLFCPDKNNQPLLGFKPVTPQSRSEHFTTMQPILGSKCPKHAIHIFFEQNVVDHPIILSYAIMKKN